MVVQEKEVSAQTSHSSEDHRASGHSMDLSPKVGALGVEDSKCRSQCFPFQDALALEMMMESHSELSLVIRLYFL